MTLLIIFSSITFLEEKKETDTIINSGVAMVTELVLKVLMYIGTCDESGNFKCCLCFCYMKRDVLIQLKLSCNVQIFVERKSVADCSRTFFIVSSQLL